MISLGIDYQLWGLNPFGYHLGNLIIHLINTLLVFFFVRQLAPKSLVFVPFFTALVFGIHPMHVESVAWISERKDVLYVLFFLLGLITYLKFLGNKSLKIFALVILFFCLSLLSKAMAVVFPVVLLLIDWFKGRQWNIRVGMEKVPFFFLSLVFGVTAYQIQSGGAIAEFDHFTFIDRMVFAAYGFCMYLVKAIVPVQLSAFYPYPFVAGGAVPGYYYAMPIIAVLLLGGAVAVYKKSKAPLFGLGFYLVTVALVLQFISVGKAIMADRYTYLPYVGTVLYDLLFRVSMEPKTSCSHQACFDYQWGILGCPLTPQFSTSSGLER